MVPSSFRSSGSHGAPDGPHFAGPQVAILAEQEEGVGDARVQAVQASQMTPLPPFRTTPMYWHTSLAYRNMRPRY